MSSLTNGAAITRDRALDDRLPANPATAPHRPTAHLPGLDGLRALAVIAVLIFHADPGWLRGGFLGVDVFFVISGFIITRALLAEWDDQARINITAFWMRRARRLLPALFLLIGSSLVYCALFQRDDVAQLREDTLAALVYATNWYQISGGQSYFASLAPPSLLQHLWSLAVEEQFYLLWPPLLTVGLLVLPRRALLLLMLLGAAASTIEMALLYHHGAGVSRVYYGTDTRAAGLLIGSALAMPSVRMPARPADTGGSMLLQVCGWLSLALLVTIVVRVDDGSFWLYNGGFAVVSLAGAALILAAMQPGALLSKVLEFAPLRWTGKRSYGIYLWHWPIFVLMQPGFEFAGGRVLGVALQIAAAVALAAISYWSVEQPIRRGALSCAARRLGAHWRRRKLTTSWTFAASAGAAALLGIWVVRVPAPELPAYFALSHVEITSAAAPASTATVAVPVSAPPPAASVPTALPTRAATATAIVAPPSPAPTAGITPQSEGSSSSASLLYVPTAAPPGRALPPASSARVTAIGDSVMLSAAQELAAVTPSIYIDAAVGRQLSAAIVLLRQLDADGKLGGIVLIDMGNNGSFTDAQFDQIMTITGAARRVVFVNLKEPRAWEATNNAAIAGGVARYANAVLVDWHAASESRPELFWSDLIHLRPEGATEYAALIAPYLNG